VTGRPVPIWLGAVLGTLAGLAALALGPGTAILWQTPEAAAAPPRDWAMALSGLAALMAEPWGWPVLETRSLAEGRAVPVLFTDSIPVAAVLARAAGIPPAEAAAVVTPLWIAALFAGQGAAAGAGLALLGLRGMAAVAAGALLVALWPAFLHRMGMHLALSAHGIVVLAAAMALAPPPPGRARAAGWAALLALAAWTHAYLLAMAAGLWALSVAHGLATRPGRAGQASRALAVAAVLGLALWAAGYGDAPAVGAGGFGAFRLDLAAPFAHGGGSLLPEIARLPERFEESHAHVPLAVWALGLAALVLRAGPPARPLMTGDAAGRVLLGLAGLAALLFATAGRIGWEGEVIATIPLPAPVEALGEILRGSARMVWPVAYALLLLAVLRVGRALGPRRGALALGLAAAAVAAETAPRLAAVLPEAGRYSGDPVLAAHLAAARRVATWPAWGCDPDHVPALDKELQWRAVASGAVMSGGIAAARAVRHCPEALPDGFAPVPGPGARLVLKHAAGPEGVGRALALGLDPSACGLHGDLALCAAPGEGAAGLAAMAVPRLSVPTRVAMSEPGAAAHLGAAFARPEPWGVWSLGPRSHLELFLARDAVPGAVRLALRGFVPPERPATGARLGLLEQGVPGGPWRETAATSVRLLRGAGPVEITLERPPRPAHRLRVVIEPEAPLSPSALGRGTDGRALGVGVLRVTLSP